MAGSVRDILGILATGMLELPIKQTHHFHLSALTITQIIFFDYQFYINQVTDNPTLVEWYRQKEAAIKGAGEKSGPK